MLLMNFFILALISPFVSVDTKKVLKVKLSILKLLHALISGSKEHNIR